jgi:hypothetical protein
MDQTRAQAEAQAQVQAQAQAQAEAQAARAELEVYVTPELLDRDIDRRHRSFLPAVLGEDVGHVRSRTAHIAADPRPLGSQARELMLCYCLYLHLSFYCTNKLHYLF